MKVIPTTPRPGETSGSISDVAGIAVGHSTDLKGATGCTVVLCEGGAVAGVDVRGASPGTRETDLLDPTSTVPKVHAVLLGGGSAFGLAAADGVVRYLKERDVGHQAPGIKVPIVPAAILFDLNLGDAAIPTPQDAYAACLTASNHRPEEGSVGAGTGATVAKAMGREFAVKGGVGTAGLRLGDGVTVGVVVATNAVGGIYDPESGRLLVGPRRAGEPQAGDQGMDDPVERILAPDWAPPVMPPGSSEASGTNTTIGVVATDARMTKAQASRMAAAAHDGLAMAVRPAHTAHDGDTFFALATGAAAPPANGNKAPYDVDRICAAVAICVAAAVVRSVRTATSLGGVPALSDL